MTDDALTAAVLAAIDGVLVDHAMWIGHDLEPLDYSPIREALYAAAVREATERVAQVVREHTAAQVAAVERERDEWRARRDLAIETCRFRHQDGLTAEEWHTRICGAMQGAQRERARAERAEAQVAAAKAEAWEHCVQEAVDCGWLHDFGQDDMAGRNPYRADEPHANTNTQEDR